jgi:hypothetical protein
VTAAHLLYLVTTIDHWSLIAAASDLNATQPTRLCAKTSLLSLNRETFAFSGEKQD